MEGMLFDCKPERVSRILKSLSSISCENWIIEGKEPNRSDLETILEFLSPEYLVPLSKLVKEPDTFPANIRIIYPGNDPIESASQLSGIVNTLHPMLRQKSEQFWTDLAYSSPGTLEIGLVSCVGLLHSGYSSKALGIFDYLLTKHGNSFDIVVLQHLISEYNKNTRSQTPSTLMDLLSTYFYLPSSARDSGDQIVRQFEKTPLVTVVMTARNPGDTALNSISHLLETSLIENLEIICIDDKSTDGTSAEILRSFFQNNNVGRLILNPKNLGIPKNLNSALGMANGKYLFCIGDDLILPGKIQADVDNFELLGEELAVTHSISQSISYDGKTFFPNFSNSTDKPRAYNPPSSFVDVIARGGDVAAPTAMLRASCIRSVEGWDESIPWEDKAMWLKLAYAGYQFSFRPVVTTLYRINPNSVSSSFASGDLVGQMRTYLPYSSYRESRKQMHRILLMAALARYRGVMDYQECASLYISDKNSRLVVKLLLKTRLLVFVVAILRPAWKILIKFRK
jgi:glycosyltransferase involved in cell wall biosynthesis